MEQQMVVCHSCGSTVPNREFCHACGARLGLRACPSCGVDDDVFARFCGNCGSNFTEPWTPAPPSAPRAPAFNSATPQPPNSRPNESPSAPPAFGHSWDVGSAPTAGSSAIGPDPWNNFQQPPVAPSSMAKANASVVGALMRSFGAVVVVLSGFLVLLIGVGLLTDKGDALANTGAVVFLAASAAFWIGCVVWAYHRAVRGWTPAFVFFGLFAVAVYAYRAARFGRSTGRRPFPSFESSAFLAAVGMILMVVAAFGGADVNATKAAPAEKSGQIALTAPSSSPKSIAAVVNPAGIPSSTARPTDTPHPTDTPQPTATSRPTQTPRPTVEPTETSTPKPTRTPKPKRTPKPQPTAAPVASFDPGQVARALRIDPVLDNENPGLGSPRIERVSSLPSDAVAGIMMQVDMGLITYYVFDSDRAAKAWVRTRQTGNEFPMPDYPQYPTALATYEESTFYSSTVGNVVVMGATSPSLLDASGYSSASSSPPAVAAVLAEYGIKRLLRIAGDAPGRDTTASDESL